MIYLDDMPGFTQMPRHHYPWLYICVQTMAPGEVGEWKIADCPNLADGCECCSIYSCMNVEQLHQLLQGLFQDHTWEWIVDILKDI